MEIGEYPKEMSMKVPVEWSPRWQPEGGCAGQTEEFAAEHEVRLHPVLLQGDTVEEAFEAGSGSGGAAHGRRWPSFCEWATEFTQG